MGSKLARFGDDSRLQPTAPKGDEALQMLICSALGSGSLSLSLSLSLSGQRPRNVIQKLLRMLECYDMVDVCTLNYALCCICK